MSPTARRPTARRANPDQFRIAVLGDIHGNVAALDAALTAIEKARPDAIAVTGDLVMNGPRPAEVIARIRTLDAAGAYVVQGNTDIAVADLDLGAAFPWLDVVPAHQVAAAEWAHEQLAESDLEYLRKLPAERRIRVGDQLVLVCHASPGSQTDGLPADLDPSVTIQRITRTDARVILCGHTHVAEWREFGRRLVCNPGSCGYAFDGDPGAAWALVTFDLSKAQSSRASTAPADRGAEAEAGAEPGAEAEAEAEADRGAEAGAETDADRGAEAGAETDSEAGTGTRGPIQQRPGGPLAARRAFTIGAARPSGCVAGSASQERSSSGTTT